MVDLAETIIDPSYANMKEDNDTNDLNMWEVPLNLAYITYAVRRAWEVPLNPPCTQTSQPSYSPPPASSPAPVRSVRGLDVVLRLGALAAVPPSVIPNMVCKTRRIERQMFIERLTVPGPPGPWPRFCCLTWAAHDMFQHFLDPAGIKRPLGLPT